MFTFNNLTIILVVLLCSNISLVAQDLKIGDIAPEIIQTTPEGKEIKLSDLRGQYVLVDFWASWCVPCRRESPYLVETYEKYKNTRFKNGKDFTIFSVTLDTKDERWVNAIKEDSLIWPYHGTDYKGWKNSAAQDYNISAVPASFLIDGSGKIIAINLRGNSLESTLRRKRVFKIWK